MKHLEIKSAHFNWLQKNFSEWLHIIGYAESTVHSLPLHIQELLHFLEQKHLTHITQVKPRHISAFASYLKQRPAYRQGCSVPLAGTTERMREGCKRSLQCGGGALSSSSINKTLQAVTTFARYLNQTGKHILDATPRRAVNDVDERTILTQEEIKELYESTFLHHRHNTVAMGQRDRAIIAIFYGCGLRKNEGSKLNISDIDLVRKLVFVRKGKGNKQRYVPIAEKHAEDLKAYLEEGRNWFLEDHAECGFYYRRGEQRPKKQNTDREAFFLGVSGKRMQSFYQRFEFMKERAGIEKNFSTHHLRHSIATHLLQSGMPLEEIARFLGHSSLESTQIYTHIVNQLNSLTKEQPQSYELAEL